MGFSRSARIKTLLAIDTAFFFLEIIVGYSVGSLALVADSFHMLNDVMSLIVALYALNLAESGTRSNKYSYGWQRAEILGALVNGVFLLALCFSIFLEAIQRMFGAPEVSSPKLVVIVGSMGLASNIVGLFLFHEHGHSHGGGGHDHGHSHGPKQVKDASAAAEEGHSHAVTSKKSKVNGSAGSHSHGASSERTPLLQHSATAPQASPKPVTGTSGTETPFEDEEGGTDAIEDLLVHPARTREAIVRQAYDAGFGSPRDTSGLGHRRTLSVPSQQQRQRSSSAGAEGAKSADSSASASGHVHTHDHASGDGHLHEHEDDDEHDHDHGDEDGDDHHGHSHGGHSHGNMNMRGVFLHVLGDALGNVGVIAAGLVIWLTKSPYRFYSDPLISFIITCIIFSSALPLVRSASFILLQGTPSHVPLEKVKSAILRIPNVISVHDLHIWSLSESKLVASMHILVKSHEEFTQCSNDVRKLLHRFGVHSSTIQPELLDGNGQTKAASVLMASRNASVEGLVPGELELDDGNCTVQCVDDSCVDSACCPPAVIQTQKSAQSLRPASQHDHDHSH